MRQPLSVRQRGKYLKAPEGSAAFCLQLYFSTRKLVPLPRLSLASQCVPGHPQPRRVMWGGEAKLLHQVASVVRLCLQSLIKFDVQMIHYCQNKKGRLVQYAVSEQNFYRQLFTETALPFLSVLLSAMCVYSVSQTLKTVISYLCNNHPS